ncbi:UNVERIFIED_CONTAM: hypothetical protein K2H54_019163 [Gekko kuhli]
MYIKGHTFNWIKDQSLRVFVFEGPSRNLLLNGKSYPTKVRLIRGGTLPPVKRRRMNWIDAPDDVFYMVTEETRCHGRSRQAPLPSPPAGQELGCRRRHRSSPTLPPWARPGLKPGLESGLVSLLLQLAGVRREWGQLCAPGEGIDPEIAVTAPVPAVQTPDPGPRGAARVGISCGISSRGHGTCPFVHSLLAVVPHFAAAALAQQRGNMATGGRSAPGQPCSPRRHPPALQPLLLLLLLT